jgi:hypothetical protein
LNVLSLTATEFIRPLANGRTRPLLLGCENKDGERLEVVVKLLGPEMAERAQIAELLAAQLADHLGLDVPNAAIVEIPPGFDAIVANAAVASAIRSSAGANFGSVHLGASFTTWPPGRLPHGVQKDQAAAIFAFDTLIQNPDRRSENPNLWARSDRLGVYDHEQAFSFLFLPIIGGAPRPWNIGDQALQFRFLDAHIFYAALRGGTVDVDSFEERLGNLSDERLAEYVLTVPAAWKQGNDFCEQVVEYLREARQERQKLVSFIKHLLR